MKVYSVYEVCEILGIARKTINKYISSGELRAVRLGNQIRITEDAFKEFLNSKSVDIKLKPIDELKKK